MGSEHLSSGRVASWIATATVLYGVVGCGQPAPSSTGPSEVAVDAPVAGQAAVEQAPTADAAQPTRGVATLARDCPAFALPDHWPGA